MEGNQLTFFIAFDSGETLITLSEYDTVEQLKIEIDNDLNIPVANQEISNWYKSPSSEDTILKECVSPSNDIHCLNVKETKSPKPQDFSVHFSNNRSEISEKEFLEREMSAISRLKEKLPSNLPFKLRQMSFQDAVSNLSNPGSQKALLLYLHNSQDSFSQEFLNLIHDEEIKTIIEEVFFVIGWDVEDQYHHSALKRALEPYGQLLIISQLITNKSSAAICLIPDKSGVALFFCLRGRFGFQSMLESFRAVRQQFEPNSCDNLEDNGKDEHTTAMEIEAIKSLKKKLPKDISVTFREVVLDDALKFICTSPFNERKALLLYLHNSEMPFSKMFSGNLQSRELAQTLNRNFLVLGWDVENPDYHDVLVTTLSRHANLAIVSDLVLGKVSIALCILPVNGTISVFLCLRGKITLAHAIKSLKEVEVAFNKEIEREKELAEIERQKSNQNDLGSEKLHSIWADMLGDRDYDSFEFDQHNYLKDKIGFALKGPPQQTSGYEEKTKTHIDSLFKVIQTQSNAIAQFKDHIEISFVYNCLEPLPEEKLKRSKKFSDYNPQTDVNPVPIFILRKCRGSQNPCRVFIDDNGRVYRSWTNYLINNKYPKCEMVVPRNGRYEVRNNTVLLERHLSPPCHLDSKLLQVGDIVTSIAGLASGCVFVATAGLAVAPPVLIAAGVVGAGAGAWALGRSIYTLYDRRAHKETISFMNSEARGAYLNIVAGSLGFAGAGANVALTQLAARGVNLGQGATYLVNTIGVLNLGAGGASLINSGYDVFDQWYNENQTPSALTILQLSSSVLFFGHAVYNFRGAQTIIEETQARVLKDYQDSLRSNRHRKTFNKLMKETIRTQGDGARGRAEVISAIRNIQNKDEVFAALTRNNKAMNDAGIKISAQDGKITLGGIAVDMNEFIGFNKKQTEVFLNNLAQDKSVVNLGASSSSNPTNNNNLLKTAINGLLDDMKIDSSTINLPELIKLTSKILIFCSSDIKSKVINAIQQAIHYIITKVSSSFAEEIDRILPKHSQFFEFLRLGVSYFSQKVDEWEQKYQKYQQTGDPIYKDPIFDKINPLYVKRTVAFFELAVSHSFSGEHLIRAVLTEIAGYVTAWIARLIFENEEKKESEKRRDRHSAGFRASRVNCSICGGYYFEHGN
ncbi:unnamed protein product [Ceutorhynchus assimilis]|uniref:DUF4781 domain-containing protein n=1 Tax=Ceutorhynchus assimilis TaxID=467358 RepID=A0A9P0DDD4_9CUCU|nr:unnamed protein product [Ceutorhynchus assimilis]